MSGVLLIIGSSLSIQSSSQFFGNIVAFIMPISFAVLIVIVRKYPKVDMVPAQFIAGVFAALIGYLVAGKLSISSHDLFLGFLAGTFQIGFGFIMIYYWIQNYSCCRSWNFDADRSSFWTALGLDFYK